MPTRKEENSGGNLTANKGEISVSTISNCNLTINNDIDFVKNRNLWKNHRIMADPKQLAANVTTTATTQTTKTKLEIIADLKKERATLFKEQAKFKREIAYLRNESFVNNQAALVQEEEEE